MPEPADRADAGDAPVARPTYSRRTALKRGAAIGTLAWAVPVVQVVSMSSANAESPSSPPQTPPETPPNMPPNTPPGNHITPQSPPGNQQPPPGSTTVRPVSGSLLASGPAQAAGPQTLAYTGFPATEAVVGGASLLAAGAALTVAASKRRHAAEPATGDSDAG